MNPQQAQPPTGANAGPQSPEVASVQENPLIIHLVQRILGMSPEEWTEISQSNRESLFTETLGVSLAEFQTLPPQSQRQILVSRGLKEVADELFPPVEDQPQTDNSAATPNEMPAEQVSQESLSSAQQVTVINENQPEVQIDTKLDTKPTKPETEMPATAGTQQESLDNIENEAKFSAEAKSENSQEQLTAEDQARIDAETGANLSSNQAQPVQVPAVFGYAFPPSVTDDPWTISKTAPVSSSRTWAATLLKKLWDVMGVKEHTTAHN